MAFPRLFRSFLVMIALSTTAPAQAGPVLAGKDTGFAEYSVIFTHAYFRDFMSNCILYGCGLDRQVAGYAGVIIRKTLPEPVFRDGADMQGRRYMNYHRHVLINRERLVNSDGREFDLGDAMALWVEIQAGVDVPQTVVASLKAHVANSMHVLTKRGSLEVSGGQMFEYVVLLSYYGADRLVLRDGDLQTADLTPLTLAGLGCAEPAGVRLTSPGWLPSPGGDGEVTTLSISYVVQWTCNGESALAHARAVISARKNIKGVLAFDLSTLFVIVEKEREPKF